MATRFDCGQAADQQHKAVRARGAFNGGRGVSLQVDVTLTDDIGIREINAEHRGSMPPRCALVSVYDFFNGALAHGAVLETDPATGLVMLAMSCCH
jgi:hypothetical protein